VAAYFTQVDTRVPGVKSGFALLLFLKAASSVNPGDWLLVRHRERVRSRHPQCAELSIAPGTIAEEARAEPET
jgi:hypothetical protein